MLGGRRDALRFEHREPPQRKTQVRGRVERRAPERLTESLQRGKDDAKTKAQHMSQEFIRMLHFDAVGSDDTPALKSYGSDDWRDLPIQGCG